MRGQKYQESIRKRAVTLRYRGKSYTEINRQLGITIPKSTLASWFTQENVPSPFTREVQLAHLSKIRSSAAKARRQQRLDRLEQIGAMAATEVRMYPTTSKALQKSMLAMLYWAEGAKHERVGGLRFVNTDPDLARLYLQLLRNCYSIDEQRLHVRLHLHYYHPITKSKRFWSNTLNIPLSQFSAAYVKKRNRKKRFRKNYMGTCFIYYGEGMVREEILATAHALYDTVATSQ